MRLLQNCKNTAAEQYTIAIKLKNGKTEKNVPVMDKTEINDSVSWISNANLKDKF